jgi:ABC-2 type transport system permease protein
MILLFRLQARRDRILLTVWVVCIALLLFASTASVATEYGTEEQRSQILQLGLATPALLALRGVPNGAGLGSAVFFQTFAFLAVAVGLMNTFLATRHGRADEERGRRELVGVAPVGRSAGLAATLLLGLIANAVLGVLAALGFTAGGTDAQGAAVAGLALALVGLCFLGLGALVGEFVATSRAANAIGVVLVLGAYALRGIGDALGTPDFDAIRLEPAWPSWLSPIGWGQQTFAFTDNRLAPLLLPLALAVLTSLAALAVRVRRDLGASLLPERTGRASARPALRGAGSLAWRLHWPTLLGWALGAALLGLVVGSLAAAVGDASATFPDSIKTVLQSLAHADRGDIIGVFVAAIAVLIGLLAAAAGVQAVLRAREEEENGRAEEVLAGPISRPRWLLSAVGVGVISVFVVLLATALATFLSFAASGNTESAWRSVGQILVQAPAALVFVAVAALLVAALPRVSVGLAWGLFALGAVIGLFGGLLRLPDWVMDASPVTSVPAVPFESIGDAVLPLVLVVAVGAALTALGAGLVRRRNVPA